MTNERGSRKFIEDAEEPTLSAPSETSFDFDEVNGNWEEVRRFLDEQAARGATDLDPFLPVVRVFLDVSRAVLQALDRGNGVYISMSWFAPGVFVPTSV